MILFFIPIASLLDILLILEEKILSCAIMREKGLKFQTYLAPGVINPESAVLVHDIAFLYNIINGLGLAW